MKSHEDFYEDVTERECDHFPHTNGNEKAVPSRSVSVVLGHGCHPQQSFARALLHCLQECHE